MAAEDPPVLASLAQVSHSFGTTTVLDGVDFLVRAGETVAILGPSGSGKTTLLSILGLLVRPDAGKVRIGARRRSVDDPPAPGLIAWVTQSTACLAARTCRENVALGLLAVGEEWAVALEEAGSWLDRLGVGYLADRAARTSSGGEMQRVAVARALATRPTLLLADEPTGQLDQRSSSLVAEALTEIPGRSTAVVVVTHDHAVAGACGRTLSICEGQLRA